MCWIGKETNKKIAKENIEVFKILYLDEHKQSLKAPFYKYWYKTNETYSLEGNFGKITFDDGTVRIDDGLHCYSNDKCFCVKDLYETAVRYIGKPCYLSQPALEFFPNIKIENNNQYANPLKLKRTNCIIPKGTIYYENEYGEIVTKKLTIKEYCDA